MRLVVITDRALAIYAAARRDGKQWFRQVAVFHGDTSTLTPAQVEAFRVGNFPAVPADDE
jgi:hypothetical protein